MRLLTATLMMFICLQAINAQNYQITNGSVSACSGAFFDNGGANNYSANSDYLFTINSAKSGAVLIVTFLDFSLSGNDWLAVYDGSNIESTLMDTYDSENPIHGEINASGQSLTFVFHSDKQSTGSGWVAGISCKGAETNDKLNQFHEKEVMLVYSIRGLKSEQDAEVLIKLLNTQEFIIESRINMTEQTIFVSAVDAEYTYKIKDLILSAQSTLGYEISVDFLLEREHGKCNHKAQK